VILTLHHISRSLLGLIFLASGVLKIIAPVPAAELLSTFLHFPLDISKIVIIAFCLFEIVIGSMLLLGGKRLRLISFLASAILLLFTLLGVVMLNDPVSCGCFGDVFDFKTDGYFLARNVVLLIISLFVLRFCDSPGIETGIMH
jgi:uncharacterized membrane protein YphA (DoxX/SURF4 family)